MAARTLRRAVAAPAALLAALGLVAGCTGPEPTPTPTPTGTGDVAPYLDPGLPVAERVEDLLGRMTLADKVGQMTQGERSVVTPADVTALRLGSVFGGGDSMPGDGSVATWSETVAGYQAAAAATPLRIPLLYGTDAVHGHNNLDGATLFPHNIGLGAAGDPDLVERVARATAQQAHATGVNWVFGPCVAVVQDTRWGRTYESFGADPDLVSALTTAVTGLQAEGVLATAKHYVGDGGTVGGVDRGDTPGTEVSRVHLAPYAAAVERGVGSVMVSFSSVDGEPMHAHRRLVTDVLKGDLGFDGFVVSDWAGIDLLDGEPGFTRDEVVASVLAGVDMVMVPQDPWRFVELLTEAVADGEVPQERIDDAVRRILTVKIGMGLFEADPVDPSAADAVGSPEHRALAREAVAASLVVLDNDGTLPLADGARVLVTGSNADDVGHQVGGWSMSWQGSSGDVLPGTTVLDGLRDALGADAVTWSADGTGAAGHDVAIAVVGEEPYAEWLGDRPDGARLGEQDEAVLARLRESGVPTVVVVVSGRPVDLGAHAWAAATVAAWLPGTEGAGVADVLTGAVAPSGRLPVPWGDRLVGYAWAGAWGSSEDAP